jgi:tRNA(Arg) A34 adenosine deaminase TadA
MCIPNTNANIWGLPLFQRQMSNSTKWMGEAIKEAELILSEGRIPIRSVLVALVTGEVVSKGHNMREQVK